jgi:UDP-glucose 4-epimerase
VIYRDDARHFGTVQAIVEKERIEVVFNLATIALNYSFFNPFDAYMVNVQIANTLLELQKIGAFRTLIHVSSSEAYGTARYSPMDENHPIDPTTPYAAGKVSSDLMALSFWKVLGLDISIVRPFNNYGPRQNAQGSLAAIIPATVLRLMKGLPPIVEGDGEQTRDFVYVGDTVRALVLAYEHESSRGKIINLGTGKELSINKVLSGICQYMKYDGPWEHRPSRISDVRRLCGSAGLAKEVLGYVPQVEYELGIVKTLDWYISNLKKRDILL